MKILSFLLPILMLTSCSSPEPNPEMKDGIYLDIQNQIAETEKSIEESKVSIQDEEKNLKHLDIQSGQRHQVQSKIDRITLQITKLNQQIQFLKIRLLNRKKIVRENGLKKFFNKENKEALDTQDEYSDYSKINKIMNRPLNFSQKRRILETQEKPAVVKEKHEE